MAVPSTAAAPSSSVLSSLSLPSPACPGAARSSRRRLAAVVAGLAVWLSVVVLGLAPVPALAAAAEGFAVSGIPVDVTAPSAVEARMKALTEGQFKAARQLLQRLVAPADHGRLPRLDEAAVYGMVRDVAVDEEKVLAARYIARLTVNFRPAAVRAYLRGVGLSFLEPAARPVLVLPVFQASAQAPRQLWEEGNPWRTAWANRAGVGGLVPITLPLGDLADQAAVPVERAVAADPSGLDILVRKAEADKAVVAIATVVATEPAPVIEVRVLQAGAGSGGPVERVTAADGAPLADGLAQAVDRVVARLEEEWRRNATQASVATGTLRRLTAMVPVGSLADWLQIRRTLGQVRVITRTEVLAMRRDLVQVILSVTGDDAELGALLAQQGLALTGAGDVRMLMRTPAAAAGAVAPPPLAISPSPPAAPATP